MAEIPKLQGRSSVPGPATGAYCTITVAGGILQAAAAARTAEIAGGFIMPFAFRLTAVSWVTGGTATANVSFTLHMHASAFQTSGATALLNATADVDADEANTALPSGTTPTLAVRTIPRGQRVFVAYTADATGEMSAYPLHIMLHGFPMGVTAASTAND